MGIRKRWVGSSFPDIQQRWVRLSQPTVSESWEKNKSSPESPTGMQWVPTAWVVDGLCCTCSDEAIRRLSLPSRTRILPFGAGISRMRQLDASKLRGFSKYFFSDSIPKTGPKTMVVSCCFNTKVVWLGWFGVSLVLLNLCFMEIDREAPCWVPASCLRGHTVTGCYCISSPAAIY